MTYLTLEQERLRNVEMRINASLPSFIAYENMRIENYAELVKSYVVCYREVDHIGADGCEGEIYKKLYGRAYISVALQRQIYS